MIGWIENVRLAIRYNQKGKCPCCGSEDTFFKKALIQEDTGMGYVVVGCNSCRQKFDVDRIQIV